MKRFAYKILVAVLVASPFFYSCSGVRKSQLMGSWQLKKYESPDAALQASIMRQKDYIKYRFTDSTASFEINGTDMIVYNYVLNKNVISMSAKGSRSKSDWRVQKVNNDYLILKTGDDAIGQRVYSFRRPSPSELENEK